MTPESFNGKWQSSSDFCHVQHLSTNKQNLQILWTLLYGVAYGQSLLIHTEKSTLKSTTTLRKMADISSQNKNSTL